MSTQVNRLGQPIGFPVPNWRPRPRPPQDAINGHFCRLEPFDADRHCADLFDAYAQDEDGRISLILFQTLDGFDATRILLPTLHEKLREYLGSPFAAGIPNRDILLCFRNDDETVNRLREQIGRDYRQMPHQVTDMILQVTPDGIAPRD